MKSLCYPLFLLLALSCGQSAGSETTIEATPNTFSREVKDWNPKKDAMPLDSMIRVTSPGANATISSPFTINGEARGGFFFEAVFPVTLTDEDGNVLVKHYAKAQESWMQPGFVDFTSEIAFDAPAGTRAWLKLENDNPSDGEGFQRGIVIPVVLE